MKNLKIATRMILLVAAFVAPLGFSLYLYYDNVTGQISFAQQEKLGTEYLRPVVKALHNVQEHYTLKVRIDDGDKEAIEKISSVTQEINNAFAEYKDTDAKIGKDLQFDSAMLAKRQKVNLSYSEILKKWQEISALDSQKVKNEQYESLLGDLSSVIAYATQYSNLLLDPDLDSYSVMDAVTVPLPSTFGRIGSSERFVLEFINSGKSLSLEDAEVIGSYATMLEQDDIARANATDMQTAYSEDENNYGISKTLRPNTEEKLNDYVAKSGDYAFILHGIIKGTPVSIHNLFEQSAAAKESAYKLWVAAADELDVLLDARISHFTTDRNIKLSIFAAVLFLAVLLNWYIAGSITKPLRKLQSAMIQIADGQLETKVPCLDMKDEVGDMARTLEVFKETSIEAKNMESSQRAEQAKKLEQQKRVEELIQKFSSVSTALLEQVRDSSSGMQKAVDTMSVMSEKTSDSTKATMSATSETSNNVAAVASAAEELTAAINEIAGQMARSATVTKDAVSKTQTADVTVKKLSEAAQQIGDVVIMISGIAEQINLLALNATIESARAGEAGKGFAVVASEVKSLAGQTSKATESISQQIAGMQQIVSEVVTALTSIRGAIEQVDGVSSTISAAVEEQGAATREIAMNIQRTSDRVKEVVSNVTEVGNMAVATNDNAMSVGEAVRGFTKQSKSLQNEIEQFLGNIAKS